MKKLMLSVMTVGVLVVNTSVAHAAPGGHPPGGGGHGAGPLLNLPVAAVHLMLGGVKYWMSDGVYYRKAGERYVVVEAPKGSKIRYLPDGAVVVERGGHQYFRHGKAYYRWLPKTREYEVVTLASVPAAAPALYRLGSVVETLPDGANATQVNGVQYFVSNGQYFVRTERQGQLVYAVVNIGL